MGKTKEIKMKFVKAKSKKKVGGGWVLYGNRPDNGRWMERWFPVKEKAVAYCNKRNWHLERG